MRLARLLAACSLVACGGGGSSPADAGSDAGVLDAADASAPDAPDAPDDGTPLDAEPDAPDIDSIEWSTGASVGYGVAFKDTGNALGDSMFVGYGGYGVDLAPAELWVTALYRATLEARGVRYVWAVQGPSDPDYSQDEIGNSKIAAALVPLVSASTRFVLVAAHSSGAFVGQELLEQLAGGADPDGATDSANYDAMQSLAAEFTSKGGFYDVDSSGAGCDPDAVWCVHDTMINTKPHDPTTLDVEDDYSDFSGRPVCTSYISAKASEAGLQ